MQGFLRLRTRPVHPPVEVLSSQQPANEDTGSIEADDSAKMVQNLAPAEGVGAFLATHNHLVDSAGSNTSIVVSFLVGLLVVSIVGYIGASDPKATKPIQWPLVALRLVAYFIFALMIAKSAGVTMFAYQDIFGVVCLVIFIFIAPSILKRFDLRP